MALLSTQISWSSLFAPNQIHGGPRAQPVGKVLMNALVLNSGRYSLKFQLIATDLGRISQNNDERLCRGQIERIGGEAIIVVQTRDGPRKKFTARDTVQCILGKPGEHRAAAVENSGVGEMTH